MRLKTSAERNNARVLLRNRIARFSAKVAGAVLVFAPATPYAKPSASPLANHSHGHLKSHLTARRPSLLTDDFSDPRGGGDGSVLRTDADSFAAPMRTATEAHRKSFVIGNALFKENWVPTPSSVVSRQGLGPLFNAQSCSSCHFKDGRGLPPETPTEIPTGLLVRISVPGAVDPYGAPVPHPLYGDQIQHRANLGIEPEADVKVDYQIIAGHYPDGASYELRKPQIQVTNLRQGALGSDTLFSARIAPQVIGLGLLEAIGERDILSRADPEDRNADGISGRPNRVWDIYAGKRTLGRFGWKANQPSLRQQNAGAFAGDMGISSESVAAAACPPKAADCKAAPAGPQPELSKADLDDMTTYVQLLAVPQRRNVGDSVALQGRALFTQANCIACHASEFVTGRVKGLPELSQQRIRPYTDLLLHDMGPELADGRPDFEATGSEWRTPPLWGLGLVKTVNRRVRLMHDGRARSIEEAILWHGGEGEKSRDSFKALNSDERRALIKFVESL